MSTDTGSFKSSLETGANQGTSVRTHVTKDYEIIRSKYLKNPTSFFKTVVTTI